MKVSNGCGSQNEICLESHNSYTMVAAIHVAHASCCKATKKPKSIFFHEKKTMFRRAPRSVCRARLPSHSRRNFSRRMQPNSAPELDRAAKIIKEADAIVFTSGAGLGVDSGLPDFRGPEGFWRAYPPMQHLNLRVWFFYSLYLDIISWASPNNIFLFIPSRNSSLNRWVIQHGSQKTLHWLGDSGVIVAHYIAAPFLTLALLSCKL